METAEAAARRDAHHITITDAEGRVTVRIGGTTVADSTGAKVLHEGKLPPRYYLPAADVDHSLLTLTSTSTHCPFKGDATYWSVTVDGETHANVVWSYPTPIPQVAGIAGLLSFYNERVELTVEAPADASADAAAS